MLPAVLRMPVLPQVAEVGGIGVGAGVGLGVGVGMGVGVGLGVGVGVGGGGPVGATGVIAMLEGCLPTWMGFPGMLVAMSIGVTVLLLESAT